MTQNHHTPSHNQNISIDTPVTLEVTTRKPYSKKDPTERWSERIREMSSGVKNRRYINYTSHKDEFDDASTDSSNLQQLTEVVQKCITKRPLTSMVIAATAGAVVTALIAALATNSKRNR